MPDGNSHSGFGSCNLFFSFFGKLHFSNIYQSLGIVSNFEFIGFEKKKPTYCRWPAKYHLCAANMILHESEKIVELFLYLPESDYQKYIFNNI